MHQWLEPVEVYRTERTSRKSQHALLFFVLPGIRISRYRDAEDPVWLISIIGHS
jgi:hypothetical protein